MNIAALKNDLRFAKTVLSNRPFQCLLQVTNRCNMRCGFCDFWPNGAKDAELTLEEFAAVSGALAGIGSFIVSIEGGEPLLRADLPAIVKIFGRHHVPLLFTNGWYMTAEKAGALFAAGLTQAGVSVDFADARRHDAYRGLPGAFERACRAVEHLRDAAPNGGKQVHIMTVLMRDNQDELESLLKLSAAARVGHQITLISNNGYRRGNGELPEPCVAGELIRLRRKYPQLRSMHNYLRHIDTYISRKPLPVCNAGRQSFNIDHMGNVSPCIEKLDRSYGNVRREPIGRILARMRQLPDVAVCQQCWTLCRGMAQSLGNHGGVRDWSDLISRRHAV